MKEFSGEGLALEEVGDLGLDALVAADDGGDGGCGSDGDDEGVAQARARYTLAESIPAGGVSGLNVPEVELELSCCDAGVGEG